MVTGWVVRDRERERGDSDLQSWGQPHAPAQQAREGGSDAKLRALFNSHRTMMSATVQEGIAAFDVRSAHGPVAGSGDRLQAYGTPGPPAMDQLASTLT